MIIDRVGLQTSWTICAGFGAAGVVLGAVVGLSWCTVLSAFLFGFGLQGIMVAILLRQQHAAVVAFRMVEDEHLKTLNVVMAALGESLARERDMRQCPGS